jgi:uncharacterized protein DUF6908
MRHDALNGNGHGLLDAPARRSSEGGKVTLLAREVAQIPASTFAGLLGTEDAIFAEETRAKFVGYCQTAPYSDDWRTTWRDFMAARGIDHGARLRAIIEARAAKLRHLRPLTKAFPAALRRVIREHSGHAAAFERAIAGFGEYSARFENAPYLPLCVEVLPVSPVGVPAVSVAHYGEQNGDLMRDPEIVFAVVSSEAWLPYECTQDYTGHYSTAYRNGELFHPAIAAGINTLANVWARNLGGQDWRHATCARANLSRAGGIEA